MTTGMCKTKATRVGRRTQRCACQTCSKSDGRGSFATLWNCFIEATTFLVALRLLGSFALHFGERLLGYLGMPREKIRKLHLHFNLRPHPAYLPSSIE